MLPVGFSAVMLEGAINTILAAIYGILCARYWGPEIAGLASLAFTLAGIFSFVSCFGIEQIVIARYVESKRHEALFLATLFIRVSGVGLSAGGVLLASLTMNAFAEEWRFLPALAFIQMGLSSLDLLRLRTQAMANLHHQVFPRLAIAGPFFLAKVASLVFQSPSDSIWLTLWLSIAETSLYLVVSIYFTQSLAPLALRPFPPWQSLKAQVLDILTASAPLFAAGLMLILFLKLDYFMLSELSGARDLGLYASAMRIMEMYLGIANLALLQIYPKLAKDHGADPRTYANSLSAVFRFAYISAAGIVIFNFAIGEATVLLLLGPDYEEVARYSTVFCLLAVPLLSGTVRGFAISLAGSHRNHLYAGLSGFAISIPFLLTLIPSMGFRGALLADAAAYTTSAMLSSWMLPSLRPIARIQWLPFPSRR